MAENIEIDEFLPYLLAHASALVSRQVDEIAVAEKISRNECKILLTLMNYKGVSLNELAEIMIIKQPTLSRIVEAMVEAGWLERIVVAEDRRAVRISLTTSGREKAKPLVAHAREMDSSITQNIGDEESLILKKILNQVISDENK